MSPSSPLEGMPSSLQRLLEAKAITVSRKEKSFEGLEANVLKSFEGLEDNVDFQSLGRYA